MKRLTREKVMALANTIFPDGGELALFNACVEIYGGFLTAETLEGPPEIIDDPRTEIEAVLGLAFIGGEPCFLSWSLVSGEDARPDLIRVALTNAVEPPEGHSLPVEPPPQTMALVAHLRAEDGQASIALFRHPGLRREEALGITTRMALHATEAPNVGSPQLKRRPVQGGFFIPRSRTS